tara:strand:- start:943 stop:1170 length:228 start_codon:yes stop_codon:yes gene_type:complete
MNEQLSRKLWKEILKTGDFLKDKLPYNPNHPKGRNSYAHVALEVKRKFKKSYKDLPDSSFQDVLDYLNQLKNNPS